MPPALHCAWSASARPSQRHGSQTPAPRRRPVPDSGRQLLPAAPALPAAPVRGRPARDCVRRRPHPPPQRKSHSQLAGRNSHLAGCQQEQRIVNVKSRKSIWNTLSNLLSLQCPRKEICLNLMRTIALLTVSNIFMTFAWYGHLKYREVPLFKVIVISWMIAFFEYCFQVPANRIGSYEFSAAQLKTIQEVITLAVFAAFSVLYLKQPLRWNYLAGFALIVAAVAVIFKKW